MSTTDLLPCPFCGSGAVFDEVTDEDSGDFGGHFIRCTRCLASYGLKFANKDDPRPWLLERWNRRAVPPEAMEAARRLLAMESPADAHTVARALLALGGDQ